jgi:hypothetical protein
MRTSAATTPGAVMAASPGAIPVTPAVPAAVPAAMSRGE